MTQDLFYKLVGTAAAITMIVVPLAALVLIREARRAFSAIDRVPSEEWFDDITASMRRIPSEEFISRIIQHLDRSTELEIAVNGLKTEYGYLRRDLDDMRKFVGDRRSGS